MIDQYQHACLSHGSRGFDLNGDGVIDFAELRFVLRSIRDVGSALSDEMIEEVLQQMDANKDSTTSVPKTMGRCGKHVGLIWFKMIWDDLPGFNMI